MKRIYLLDLTELNIPEQETFCEDAVKRVDAVRREKAERIRGRHERMLSLGAGLLLQWLTAGIREGFVREQAQPEALSEVLGAAELLRRLEMHSPEPAEIRYRFGAHGKPEFADVPLRFSLSHSGDYVLCAASDGPVGADIQQIRTNVDVRKTAERFFTAEEREAVMTAADQSAQRELFFRLWVRREAYAKLTGEGLAPILGRPFPERLKWTELAAPQGYAGGICWGNE